jgi:hypothetical protein
MYETVYNCKTMVMEYYKFIQQYPDKYLDDFMKQHNVLVDCSLSIPSEK